MLTIFNRKELMVTMDSNRQAEIRRILSQNGIDYIVKTRNLQNSGVLDSSRGHMGHMGLIKIIHMNIKSMYIKRIMTLRWD